MYGYVITQEINGSTSYYTASFGWRRDLQMAQVFCVKFEAEQKIKYLKDWIDADYRIVSVKLNLVEE